MKCPKCQFENPEGSDFRLKCGCKLELQCSQRANRLAYDIHREMTKFSEKIRQEKANNLHIKTRIGIHKDPVVVGTLGNDLRVEFKAVDDAVNFASRIEKLAVPGSIYVSEDNFKLSGSL